MKIFFTADWHLGDKRSLLFRPFNDVQQMIDQLVDRHNEVVSPDDLVYHLGDVTWKEAPEFLKHVQRFNGRKILLRGNHDQVHSDEGLLKYFDSILPEGYSLKLKIEGRTYNLNHYPSLGSPVHFNLVGHVHGAWRVQPNALNVGVDVHHFYPIPDVKLDDYYSAVRDHYDQDVWMINHSSNQAAIQRLKSRGLNSYSDNITGDKE